MSSYRHAVGVALLSSLLLAEGLPAPASAASIRASRTASPALVRPAPRPPARRTRSRLKRIAVRLRRPLRSIGRELRGTRQEALETPAARAEADRLHRQFANRTEVLADQAADAHVAQVMAHSQRGGRYLVLSDLHWGGGRTGRGWWPGEDFRQDETFVRFIESAAGDRRPTTLIFNGDWLELIRQVDYDSSLGEIERVVRGIVRGHEREVRALADAVANRGLRVLYTRGNHDVPLVDPRVREILTREMIRVGRLDRRAAERFRRRVAWSGHAALIGARGEGLVFHGDLMDSINNWRSPVNPYDGHRKLEPNLGWQIVSTLLRPIDLLDRAMTEREKISGVYRYVRRTVDSRSALGLLLRALLPIPRRDAGERLAAQDDDRLAMRAWVARTGVAELTRGEASAGDTLGQEEWARAFERVVARSPEPILDRLRSNTWGINVARVLFGFASSLFSGSRRDRQLIDRVGALPSVRYAIWGHTHLEATLTRPHPSKGSIQYMSSGTWTRMDKGWPLDVVVATTDADGRLALDGLHRTQESGVLAAVPLAEINKPRSRWQRAFRRDRPSTTPMLPAADPSAPLAAAQR
jgi:UDP-2,3-diacylglucosamine pyrophosphatase LpxH